MKLRALFAPLLFILVGVCFTPLAHASESRGSIDPRDEGFSIVNFFDVPDTGSGSMDSRINFGKFTTQEDYNISITDDGLFGYAWGALSGWIVMNCTDTTSGCTDQNGDFGVGVSRDGTLSGYAWGENTGWINFGPFTNETISQVQIKSNGEFGGTEGDAGYAWSQNFGWITFDCSTQESCIKTDYRPARYRNTGPGGTLTQCRDTIDNDGDGQTDDQDPDCNSGGSEFPPVVPPADIPTTPGTTTPETPTTPATPSVPGTTPTTPTEPTLPEEPPTEGEGTVFPGGLPDDIAPSTPSTITDVFDGDMGVPQARDWVVELLHDVTEWLKVFFDRMNQSLVSLMAAVNAKTIIINIAIAGLLIIVGLALVQFLLLPVAGFQQLLLLPYLFWQNMLAMLGIVPASRPWGIVYDSLTHQPLAFVGVSVVDGSGRIVANTVTQSDGSFAARVLDGSYSIHIDADNAVVNIANAAPVVFDTIYMANQPVVIMQNQPTTPFDVAVLGSMPTRHMSSFQEFLLYHEVSLTNVSFVLFGIGMLAALLYVIFFPSFVSLIVMALYVMVAVLRTLGVFGSYASIFLAGATEAPVAGALVTAYDAQTNAVVAKTLTSGFGRGYLTVPAGYFYTTVTDRNATAGNGGTIMSKPFATHGGLFRKRFLL